MTTHPDMPSAEQIKSMVAKMLGLYGNGVSCGLRTINEAADMLRAIAAHLESQPEGREVEAVAWRCKSTAIGSEWFYRHGVGKPYGNDPGMEQQPLYTSPQPGAVVTEEMVNKVAKIIADHIGHGMREKCEGMARAALEAVLRGAPCT